ncbi:hypothetical protein M0804_003686 [Polistes exclamans]|nr:hypothetical protein M0804_003686 [Polistes exclamans]
MGSDFPYTGLEFSSTSSSKSSAFPETGEIPSLGVIDMAAKDNDDDDREGLGRHSMSCYHWKDHGRPIDRSINRSIHQTNHPLSYMPFIIKCFNK